MSVNERLCLCGIAWRVINPPNYYSDSEHSRFNKIQLLAMFPMKFTCSPGEFSCTLTRESTIIAKRTEKQKYEKQVTMTNAKNEHRRTLTSMISILRMNENDQINNE